MIRDQATVMQERDSRAAAHEEATEALHRHAPRDYPRLVPDGPPAAPWRVSDERTLFDGRLGYTVVSDDERLVAFVEDYETALLAAGAPELLDALETLFDKNGMVTGRRLSSGMAKARLAMARARLGFP